MNSRHEAWGSPMTMKTNLLRTYWTADDAYLVIGFLDELRDLLWATYGEEIIDLHRGMADHARLQDKQTDLPFVTSRFD